MTVVKTRKIKSALNKKGFTEDTNTDHYYYTYYYEGTKTGVNTHISFSDDEIDDWLIRKMSMQMHLTKEQFMEFVKCPLTEQMYVDILKEKGEIKNT